MRTIHAQFQGKPYATVVANALGAQSTKLHQPAEIEEVEGVAWAAYERFMATEAGKLPPAEIPRHLYIMVRRAIVDEWRRLDPLSRYHRELSTAYVSALEELTDLLGRRPTLSQLAGHIGTTTDKVQKVFRAAFIAQPRTARHAELDRYLAADTGGKEAENRDAIATIHAELAKLPPVYAQVLRRSFLEGASMRTVAKEIQRTPARAGQIQFARFGRCVEDRRFANSWLPDKGRTGEAPS